MWCKRLRQAHSSQSLLIKRGDVHRDGDYHRPVHVWIVAESTQELLLQRRVDCKYSWAGLWDVPSAGHISAGDSSLISASTINEGKFINNEYNDVYLVTIIDPIPLEAFTLQDVKGPQTVASNLPNDERIVKDRRTSMVMLKNVSEAKFKLILKPIADVCIMEEQRELVDFESFFTHTICHEC